MPGTITTAVTTVTIAGEIDAATCGAMRDALTAGLGRSPHLEANLSGVTFFGAAGIGVLLAVRRQALEAGGSLVLRAPSRPVRKLVSILGLSEVLPAVP
jgi:anti-anti-sigma factor